MRPVIFEPRVRAEATAAGLACGYAADVIDGVLATIAHEIGRTFDDLLLRQPDYPERRGYMAIGEGVGLVEAICEDQNDKVVVIQLHITAFNPATK